MNTKPLPAVLALIAGFITCIMSFVQHVDTFIFAKRFVIVCVVFFAIGIVLKVILDKSIKMPEDIKDQTVDVQTEEEQKQASEDVSADRDKE